MWYQPAKLWQVLDEQGRRQTWLALRIGVKRSTLTQWKRRGTPVRRVIALQIAEALGMSLADLFVPVAFGHPNAAGGTMDSAA